MFNQAAVSYPARTINTLAFSNNQQQQISNQQPSQTQQSNQNQSQAQSKYGTNRDYYSNIGIVTNVQGDCGVIDDLCCFYRPICVKGIMPKLGDRVLGM